MTTDADYLSPDIPTIDGNRVTPLIDGADFATELATTLKLATGSGDFILVHSWCLGLKPGMYIKSRYAPWAPAESGAQMDETYFPEFSLTIDGVKRSLLELLIEKANAGVDVRVLGWVSPLGMGSGHAQATWFTSYAFINAMTCNAILALRDAERIGAKAALSAIGHAAGASHAKIWVIGNDREAAAFTGGLDMVQDRFAAHSHSDHWNLWHDISAKIEGPAVQTVYDAFRYMWNVNALRRVYRVRFEGKDVPSFLPQTPQLPPRTLSVDSIGTHRVQSLRTIPASKYSALSCFRVPPPETAAPNGLFQVKMAWQHAISTAETYIYMEDQSFWSRDVMDWINARLRSPAGANVKVILVLPGRGDPNDPEFATDMYLNEAFNTHLMAGLSDSQKSRIRAFQRWGPTETQTVDVEIVSQTPGTAILQTNSMRGQMPKNQLIPAWVRSRGLFFRVLGSDDKEREKPLVFTIEVPTGSTVPSGEVDLLQTNGITIHSKTTIIDDRWALIGSANCMRRSLYTDWEHAVAFIDTGEHRVAQYRRTLWNEHFMHDNPDDFSDLQSSLHSWEPTWGSPSGSAPPLPSREVGDPGPAYLSQILPLPLVPISEDAQEHYDVFDDADSRVAWGSFCDILRGAY